MIYWISCNRFTVRAETDGQGRIISTAPITRRFIGQPIANLRRWAATFGEYQEESWN
jgi:hypothetical protein